MKHPNIKSSIITTLLASLALLSGCAVDAGDDSAETATVEEAAAWGGPGHKFIPKALVFETGDPYEYYRETCQLEPATRAVDAFACVQTLYKECALDGGNGNGENTAIGNVGCDCVARCRDNPNHASCQPGGSCVGAVCKAAVQVRCLFKSN